MKRLVLAILAATQISATTVTGETFFNAEQRPQLYCLAQNIYYETRGSSRADQAAVADVVLNRVADHRYPNTICGVVRQGKKHADGSMVRNKCQFSWYCDGKSDWPTNQDAWNNAKSLAFNITVFGDFSGITEGATHYHADYVNPRWARHFTLTGTIGRHKFYRWERNVQN
jgi:spore germination cell wall hydrolase CwlJ-like protein